jgi:hypothetical protein
MSTAELKEQMEGKIDSVEKNLNNRIDNFEENVNLKLSLVNNKIDSGNELLLIKINEVLYLKSEIKNVDIKAESAKKDAKLSAYIWNNPKFSIILLVCLIIIVCLLVESGYAWAAIKLLIPLNY